jgi:hypothetical protein
MDGKAQPNVSSTPGAAPELAPDMAPIEQPVTRSTLLGAEMLNWSDLEPGDARGPLAGPAAAELLEAVLDGAGRVLVAGPHATELIQRAAGRSASLDVVLRSYDDAELIAEALGLEPGAEPGPVRVFAGGFDRYKADGEYDVIVALDGIPRLASTDTPALSWADAVGDLRRSLAPNGTLLLGAANAFALGRLLDVPDPMPADDEWGRDVTGSGEPPAGLAAIEAAIDHAGLVRRERYCVFPDATRPDLGLVDPVASLVARAVAERYAGRPTQMDPYRTAHDAVAGGHGVGLAPGYWFVLGHDPANAGTLPTHLGTDSVPPGELVEELMLAAVRSDDHTTLHRIVAQYADWLRSADPATAAQAAPDNVLADGASYTILRTGHDTPETEWRILAVRHLARFVRRTLAAGSRWPWPAGGSPRSQTARLAAMAGIAVDDELWAAAAEHDEPVQPQGYAEQRAVIARLTAELAETRAQVDWFETQLDKLRRSRSYRVGRAIVNPLRTTYGKLRSRLR